MRRSLFSLVSLGMVALGALLTPLMARADQSVYTDSLQNGWVNYSWATVNFSSPSPTHAGADAVSVDSGGYQALYLHHTAFDSTAYGNLVFWINGGASGGQTLQVNATLNGTAQAAYALPPLTANTWTQVTIPLSSLGVAGTTTLDGFWIQSTSSSTLPTYYVDDIAFTGGPAPVDPGVITVDASAGRHPISPLIYGVAFGDANSLADLNAPLNRSGGNGMTTYNWLQNATNHANDYFFESLPENGTAAGQLVDSFVSSSKAAGAQSMITVPTIGWVAKLGPNRSQLDSFSVAKYGPQQSTDPYHSDAGNGVKTDGTYVTGNDPNDANVPSDVNFQGNWIDHLVSTWGQASNGGVNYYLMDNEPSIWQGTHRDIHPTGPTMDEIYNDIVTYGARVKSADPTALVAGPEEWGWSGYFYSGYDQQYGSLHNYSGTPDRAAHNNMDYSAWLLQQLAAHDQSTGIRTLDVFSLHCYPQGGEFGEDVSESMALLRNKSTRDLWDPAYVSQSWINDKVMLIPRMKNWVNTYYPGTKIGITEYNWGAEGNINGATTQADIYGIFGREGLDLATRWTTPGTSSPVYTAMKLYRNYDGSKSGFGDTSVSDTAASPDNVSSFASIRSSDGALTVMVINKQLHTSAPLNLTLKNFTPGGPAQAWQVTSANTITRLADTPISGGLLQTTVPLQSITLFVVPRAAQSVALTPIADTTVRSGSYANTNFGADTTLAVKKQGAASGIYNRVTYLKFDLSKITTAPKTALLSLTLSSNDKTVIKAVPCKVYGIAHSSWRETTLTWNIAAASESLKAASVTSSGTYLTTTSVGPSLGTYTWDVSSYLSTKAGQIVTLQIIDDSGAAAFRGFNSKEAATGKPTLTVTY